MNEPWAGRGYPASAPDSVTPGLPKLHAHPQDQAEAWLAETYEPDDANAVAYDRSDMIDAYHSGWKQARELTAEALKREQPQPAPERGAAMAALAEVAASHERVMYAAWIDVTHGDPNDAATILAEQLDGYDGPQWDGKETGIEWLERTAGLDH